MNFGSSLPVPSVQELAKENLAHVPPRYLHPHQQHFLISHVDGLFHGIPVVDMQNLLSEEAGNSELAKLHLACKEWGFFQLINHELDSNFLDKIKLEIRDFFNLAMSEKKKFWQSPQDVEGDTLECYSEQLNNIAMTIFGHVAKVLESKEIKELFEDGTQILRINYYPPCPEPEKVIGLTPHSDGAGLTILLQVNEVDGLQIRKDGLWVPVKPLPNAFIVNVGDVLEIITNGVYRSIEHRARVNSEKERISIAAFHSVRQDGVIGPAASLISEQKPAGFKRIGLAEYYRSRYARKLDGKSHLDAFKIEHQN
ncbi:hypothetical protein RJT34_29328 [Clitoria ternatea]|uniref:Fe2OG dioxygenase domain-containing protein n=1 Tax=Clitoria ternatea TaxID=43366 RepID=A0AAN9FC16_CLITE